MGAFDIEMDSGVKTNRLDSIQFLRGIAVLLVIAFHFRQYLNSVYAQSDLGDRLFGLGEVGVDIFFVISGFIIVYSSRNREKNTPVEFSIKRMFRLYPVYLCVLLFLLLLDVSAQHTISQVVKSIFLIPNDYNFIGPWYGYSINLPAWTLTYEMLFYAIFAASIAVSHKHRTVVCIILMVAIVCASQIYFRGHLQLDPITRDTGDNSILRNLTFISNPIVYDFIYGMLIAELYSRVSDKIIFNKTFSLLMLCVLCISVATIISGYNRGAGVERWGLVSFALVGSLVMLSKGRELRFGNFWLVMGEMSYSLYLNHMVIKKLAGIYLRDFGIYKGNGGVTLFIILLILTFVMSCITYHFIERPCVNLGHQLAEKIREKNSIKWLK
ncbi:acyltransferase family protein [Cronobacter turicensis]|nr:acyltransferase [Cronobacter turicensis]MDI6471522.1 acyltransferase [Cronobacter turicensis]